MIHRPCGPLASQPCGLCGRPSPCLKVAAVCPSMSAVSDSEVTFKAKALQHGIPQSSIDKWETLGIKSYSQLLFRVASAPNAVDATKLKRLVEEMFPPANEAVTSALNRLLFEAGTFVVAELKQSLEGPAAEPTRRLSTQERASRLEALQSQLGSFSITGQYEPSHQLVDAFSSMLSDQSIRHVPLNRCSSREQEVANTKRDECAVATQHAGSLRPCPRPKA